jgi:hypothetical protein
MKNKDSRSETEDSQSETEDSQSETEDSRSKTEDSRSKTKDSQNKLDTYIRSIFSTAITLFGLIYLLLLLSGQVDKQSKRFQIPEVIIFTVILLINSETLQRVSKVQVGKDGVSLELNELKKGQKEIKQNQEKIKETQVEQREYIAELRQICDKFLENNQFLITILKQLSGISLGGKSFPENSPSKQPEDDSVTPKNDSVTIEDDSLTIKNASVTIENASKVVKNISDETYDFAVTTLFKVLEKDPNFLDLLVTGKERLLPNDKTQSNRE